MRKSLSILILLACFVQACTEKPKSALQQPEQVQQPNQTNQKEDLMRSVSAVWTTGNETVTIDYDNSRLIMLYGDAPLQFSLGDIDLSNETINLIDKDNAISTLRKVWNTDKTSYKLSYTSPNGNQDILGFVRKVTSDDKNRIANIHSNQAQQELSTSQSEMAQLKEQYTESIKENKLVREEINNLWKKFAPDVQAALLDDQRAWVIQKKQKCGEPNGSKNKPVSFPISKEDFEKKITDFDCDTQMTRERIIELNGG